MPSLPESAIYLLVRTHFGDDSHWEALKGRIEAGSAEGFFANVEYVDDRQWEGFSSEALEAAHPHRSEGWDVMYVADEQAIIHPTHPVLLVRVGNAEDQPFRCRADFLYEVDANLSLANLDWDDFRDRVDEVGVYGGTDVVNESDVQRPIGPLDAGAIAGYDEEGDDRRREAAEVAGQRIGVDLDAGPNARPLSGQRGTAMIDVTLPREMAEVWPLIASLDITTISGPNDPSIGNEFSMGTFDVEQDGFVGTNGQIICQWTELEEPTRVAMTWRWAGTRHDPSVTRLSVTLADRTVDIAQPLSRLVLAHAELPVEWVEDMTTVWITKVDQWAYQSRPRRRR